MKKTIFLLDILLSVFIVVAAIIVAIILSLPKNTKNFNTIDYSVYEKLASTGDIIIFSHNSPVLRYSLQSSWSHIGVIIKFPDEKQILLYER